MVERAYERTQRIYERTLSVATSALERVTERIAVSLCRCSKPVADSHRAA